MDAQARLFYDEQEALRFLLEQEFGMSEYTESYVRLFTALHESNKKYGLVDEANIIHGEEYDTITIPVLDPIAHTEVQPFCSDYECPCHEDRELVNALTEQVTSGLLNVIEANRIYRGEQL